MKRMVGARARLVSFCWAGLVGVACAAHVVNLGGHADRSDGGGTGGTESAGATSANGGSDNDATSSTNGGAGGNALGTGAQTGAGGDGGMVIPNQPNGLKTTHKLDLLLVVDNSSSMKDKQDVLTATLPDLVDRITAPPSGITDLHVGVITTSLGDHGAGGTCPAPDATPLVAEENNDNALLLGTRPRAASLNIPSGFLTWTSSEATDALKTQLQGLVGAADQQGCGFEATLEAAYRFLADPAPPQSIRTATCPTNPQEQCATGTGINEPLLAQRAAFLRSDSAVAVVVLSDENDCSIRDEQQAYLAAQRSFTVPNGTDVCATNPNDPCCYNCALGPSGSNCPPPSSYPACQVGAPAADNNHNFNLRCTDERRRFGTDFLYPVKRYVNALSRQRLCTSRDDLTFTTSCPPEDSVANPLFSDLSNHGNPVRDPSLVFLVGIVGVPWQDLQASADANGTPFPTGELHLKTPAQMVSDGTWAVIAGNPNASPPALSLDPLMQESTSPRGGSDPVTSVGALVGPTNAPRFGTAGANPANGHEWNNVAQGDLEYACIFPLASPRDDSTLPTADCGSLRDPNDFNPLCQAPDGTYGTTQYFAKGYPGLRELAVVQGLGNNGLAASICARNLTRASDQDFGYRPVAEELLDALSAVSH